jgi:crossover junction endodeoxyribonuclease RuvC
MGTALTMRILGVDCGSARTGYGVIESDGRDHRMVVQGVICTNTRWSFEKRLLEIAVELRRVMQEHHPQHAAVEEVFHAVNAKTALKLAHVRGVVLLTIAEAGLDLAEYSPLEVKMNVVGYGRAEKCQVQQMVQSILRLPQAIASEDAADALAVALCHATHEAASRMLA